MNQLVIDMHEQGVEAGYVKKQLQLKVVRAGLELMTSTFQV